MAAGDRARPGRDERGAARSAGARQPAPDGAGAARVAGWTASGVRAGRREGDEHAARARRRNGTPTGRPPRQWGRGLRLAGRYPRGHAARLHEPLADPERSLPLGTGTGVAAHDARRSSGRARSGWRTAGCDRAWPRFGPPDGARARSPARRRVGGCGAVTRWTLGGWEPERGRSLGTGALAGGFARCRLGVGRDRWQHRRCGVVVRWGALVRRRPHRGSASVPLARFGGGPGGRRAAAHERAARRRAPAPLADGTLLYAALRARGWE